MQARDRGGRLEKCQNKGVLSDEALGSQLQKKSSIREGRQQCPSVTVTHPLLE